LIILHDGDQPEDKFALIKKISVAKPSMPIIAASSNPSPTLILGSIRAGAREFLQLPIVADELTTVIERISELCSTLDDSTNKQGRIVAVFSGKGGAGASFVATNLAAAMQENTLLVDLNLQSGDVASLLSQSTKYSVVDFVRNLSRIDTSLIGSLISPYSDRLSILAAPAEAHEAEEIKPQDLTELLHLVTQRFDHVILDLPHAFDPITVAALDLADDILIVLTLDIPGIRSTKRALKVFDRLDYSRDKIHCVVNRWGKNIDVELQKVQSHLGERFIGLIPNDYRKVIDSINLGRPLVESDPSSKITAEIKRIAALVSNNHHTTSPHPRQRFLQSVFRRTNSPEPLELMTRLGEA
jgi:pilus assembly protein CpaE